MTSASKSVYMDKLDDKVNKYNSAYHSTINMKPVDVKSDTYIESSKEINNKYSKFKIGDIVRMSKCKYIFTKGYTSNWSEEVFIIKEIENTVPWTYVINDVNKTFYKKQLQETNQKEFRIIKLITKKGDNLYVKWKGYNNLINSWIDKKNII